MKTKTILATSYAVNPYKGSEDGMGWNFICQIARFHKVIAITRENNQEAIEKFQMENPNEIYSNITFYYFDLPYWMRFWKKGGRGALLYYYLWQKKIIPFIKKRKLTFDIAHNVNFHNDWTPSFLWKLKKPMVWGPIGHHPLIPKQYLKPYATHYFIKDRITWIIKNIFWKFSYNLKNTSKHASHILCMNSGVAAHLNIKSEKFSILPSVATSDFFSEKRHSGNKFTVLSVGRFVPLKGFDLTLLSFLNFLAQLPITEKENCKLILVGTGPEKHLYQKIINEHKAEENVEIIEWIDRDLLMKKYESATVFLFPSHEGAGMVVAEALSFGLPVVCLKNEGPGEFITEKCGFAVPKDNYNNTLSSLTQALQNIYFDQDLSNKMSLEARKLYLEKFTWNSRGDFLKNIYNNV